MEKPSEAVEPSESVQEKQHLEDVKEKSVIVINDSPIKKGLY
jgi:hypothetical protein